MRYCNNCHRLTTGDPLYCNHCGSTYEVKLCAARHVNSRNAEVCSQCGSREFSTPAPKLSFWIRPFIFLLTYLPGILLLLLSIMFFFAFIQMLVSNQQLLGRFLCMGLVLGLLWYVYMLLPKFIRDAVRKTLGKKPKERKDH